MGNVYITATLQRCDKPIFHSVARSKTSKTEENSNQFDSFILTYFKPKLRWEVR